MLYVVSGDNHGEEGRQSRLVKGTLHHVSSTSGGHRNRMGQAHASRELDHSCDQFGLLGRLFEKLLLFLVDLNGVEADAMVYA